MASSAGYSQRYWHHCTMCSANEHKNLVHSSQFPAWFQKRENKLLWRVTNFLSDFHLKIFITCKLHLSPNTSDKKQWVLKFITFKSNEDGDANMLRFNFHEQITFLVLLSYYFWDLFFCWELQKESSFYFSAVKIIYSYTL